MMARLAWEMTIFTGDSSDLMIEQVTDAAACSYSDLFQTPSINSAHSFSSELDQTRH